MNIYNIYLEIIAAAMSVVFVTGVVYLMVQNTSFGRMNARKQQVIIGILFGILSILGTELGIEVKGALINVRDAAPLCAGLVFGAPAGIIAGLMGGIERYFAVYWGAGTFTREACSIATITAGFMAGFLRKYMFDNKKPAWFFGPFLATVTEVCHMLLVFAIHMDNAREAFVVVQACFIPMTLLNGVAVGLSLILVAYLSGEGLRKEIYQRKLTVIIQKWLLLCIIVVAVITSFFTYHFQNRVSENENNNLLKQNIEDIKRDISDVSDHNILMITREVAEDVNRLSEIDAESLKKIASKRGVSEINYVNDKGIITATTNAIFNNYDMDAGDQSREFLFLLNGMDELVQEYGPVSYSDAIYRKYAGVVLKHGGFIQVGYDAEKFQSDIHNIVSQEAQNRRVGESGFVVITNHEFEIISDSSGMKDNDGSHRKFNIKYSALYQSGAGSAFLYTIDGTLYRCMYDDTEGYYIFALLSDEECRFDRDRSIYITTFMEIMLFSFLFVLIYFLIKRSVVDNIVRVNKSLGQITGGNLDVKVDVDNNDEFSSLANGINSTVDTLKNYIAEAAARIDQELEYARTIQYATLPHVFPPFPERKEFEIWAGMVTAKEVGGDFYDFYFVDANKLAFLVADVSGKGIPASLFMMKADTTIKNLAFTGMPINQVFMESNDSLCENNDAEMFVTAWMGALDTETGLVQFSNAGHNDPLVYHKEDGQGFRYVPVRRNLVLAGMEGVPYRIHEMQLQPGDMIFLYTDGVSEATNAHNELYGEERLQDCLNRIENVETMDVKEIAAYVKKDVDDFVGDSPQFDDITMLCLRYVGNES